MNSGRLVSKLGMQIIISVCMAMLCAMLLFLALSFGEKHFLSELIIDENYVKVNTQKEVDAFQKFVTQNNISTEDMTEVAQWVIDKRNIMMTVYDGDKIIYDSTIMDWGPKKENDVNVSVKPAYKTMYSVQFADKNVEIEIFCFFQYRFFVVIGYIKLILSFICFMVVTLYFVRKKTRYIEKIESEIKILESGDLSYSITQEGNDELTSLARSINDMRLSLIERQEEEANAINANYKLVTTMSHDLRTPLTVLIGLLEIIDGKKYNSKEQLEVYIRKSRDKAYQIKDLSDKIFEYFLAYNIKSEELEIDTYDCKVINEIIEDYVFTLKERGYNVRYDLILGDIELDMDIKYIHRVFDNVFSNIMKYADSEREIDITNSISRDNVSIVVHNYIAPVTDYIESTNIGLETCRNIMVLNGGEFNSFVDGDTFTAYIIFKIKN